MKTMEIYEPAMCCSTGLCGVSINPELLRVATNLNNLKEHGIIVNRYNLNSAPTAFMKNEAVNRELQQNGTDTLPLIVVNGEIVMKKCYPTNEEFAALLEVPTEYVTSGKVKSSGCCCGSNKNGCC